MLMVIQIVDLTGQDMGSIEFLDDRRFDVTSIQSFVCNGFTSIECRVRVSRGCGIESRSDPSRALSFLGNIASHLFVVSVNFSAFDKFDHVVAA